METSRAITCQEPRYLYGQVPGLGRLLAQRFGESLPGGGGERQDRSRVA